MTQEEAKRLLMSSSSSAVPYSASVIPEFSTGANTTDKLKSSSTAPAETAPVEEVKKPVTPTVKTKKLTDNIASESQTQNTVPYTPPAYTAPENAYEQVNFAPAQAGWFGEGQGWQDPSVAQEPERDPHRSLLQFLMGWDDVPYGRKWNHYLQHGLVGVSSDNVANITKMAALENAQNRGMSATFGQELRAKEQKRRTLNDQWNKLLTEYNQGRYSGDDENFRYFMGVAEALRNEFAKEGINPNTLRPPALNAGGFSQGFHKALQDDRAKLDWLGGWLDQIQQHVAADPNWLTDPTGGAQMYFDKLSEYTILNWAQSKGAIADAEKVRAQVEAMPYKDRVVFDKFMNMFFGTNAIAQLESMSDANNRQAKSIIRDMNKFLNYVDQGGELGYIDKNGNVQMTQPVESIGGSVLLGYKTLNSSGTENNPININTAVTSYKNAKDAFLNYVMQNANVDRKMVWESAVDQYRIYKDMYNRKLPKLGLQWGWGYEGPKIDENFGNYLEEVQSHQEPAYVMQNARLAYGNPPPNPNDPRGGHGGRGGNAVQKPAGVPDGARWDDKHKAWVYKRNGRTEVVR